MMNWRQWWASCKWVEVLVEPCGALKHPRINKKRQHPEQDAAFPIALGSSLPALSSQ